LEIHLNNITSETEETPQNTLPEVTFEQLPERLQTAATNANWTILTPVQRKAIPYLFAKKAEGRVVVRGVAPIIGSAAAKILTVLQAQAAGFGRGHDYHRHRKNRSGCRTKTVGFNAAQRPPLFTAA
jgi:hypothetical protein